ncbi:flippase [Eubacterium ruminantium]|uniref:flippase n=1 Tax=Eubacterium ruminantium TaxID=42322 RepID=UPI00156A038F|nr:flippase [Eubacterium ruminantium]
MAEHDKVKKEVSLKMNFILNSILAASNFIFPLISFPYVSRVLKAAGNGNVNWATDFVAYFAMIAGLGIPTYGIKACAKVRDDRKKLSHVVQELFIINTVVSLLSATALTVCIFTIPKLREDKKLFMICGLIIFFNLIGMEWVYKGLEKYKFITVRSMIFKAIALVGMFLFVHKESDYLKYAVLTIFASSASSVLNLLNIRKYVSFKKTGPYEFRKHMKAVSVFFAMSCATIVYTKLDSIMLGFMINKKEVGYYHASVKIKEILVTIVTSLGAVLLPRASYYVKNNMMDEFRRISGKAINFVMVLAAPLMLYFMIFATEGIYFLAGPEYTYSIVPMIYIMPTLFLIGLSNILGMEMLVPTGREKIVLYSVIAGAVTDLALNLIYIPKLGAAGAALGTLVAECVVLIWQCVVLRDEIRELFKNIFAWKILLGLLIGSASCFWVKLLPMGNTEKECFIKIIISGILFFGSYGVTLLVTKEKITREIFDSVIGKLRKKKN